MRAVAAPSQDEIAVCDPMDDDVGARGAGLDLEGYRIDARHIGTRSSFDEGHTAGIVAVGLVDLRLQYRPHVPRLDTDHR